MTLGIKFFDIVEETGTLITDNVEDVYASKRKGNRWVFPTFPTSNKNYPQVTVELTNPTYEPGSADDYLGEDNSGSTYKVYRFKKATATLNLHVISGKEQEIVANYNSENIYLSNQKLNTFIANLIKDYINSNNSEFLKFSSRFDINNIEFAFEDNDYSWASTISVEVKYKDIWVTEYVDGRLIQSYTLNKQTY